MNRCRLFIALIVGLTGFAAQGASDMVWRYQENSTEYDTMTIESYEIALAAAQQREKNAREQIAEEQAKIESLKQQIADTEARIAAVIQEKYDILGITEQDVIDAETEIASIRQELELLLGLSPDELSKRMADIKKCEARIAALKAKPVSYLWRIRDQIIDLEQLMERVKSNLPDKPGSYTVRLVPERRECLWRISEYQQIYGDPAQWPKLYRANQPLIDRYYTSYSSKADEAKYTRAEDLIIPGWELDVPR
jgi:nucleoid-associated protein YgaU